MVILTIVALILGIIYGFLGLQIEGITYISNHIDYILYALMFFVGISLGHHKGILDKLRTYHMKIFIIPVTTILCSVIGGAICSFITPYEINEGMAVAGGLGWYSLSGITVGELGGTELGGIAFLSNLMREIFSLCSIPLIAKYMNGYCCIAAAAATSEDTTLPMLMKYTNEEIVMLAVLNGVICSAVVPFLVPFCFFI